VPRLAFGLTTLYDRFLAENARFVMANISGHCTRRNNYDARLFNKKPKVVN